MHPTTRPRRSVLYMPGSNPRALEKARTLAADGLILDIEDAVAPDQKAAARDNVVAASRQGYGRREVLIRVNGLGTPWGLADLHAAANANADGVLLPKVETVEELRTASAALDAGGAPPTLPLWCMIETPLGVIRASELAAEPRVAGLVMGTSDLAKELRCAHTPGREPFFTAFGATILAGRAYGLAVLDGVHLDLEDAAGLEAACRQGRDFGFDGKTLIHPKQLEAANAVFAPAEAELAHAERVIAAFAEAEAQGRGVVLLDGRLVENLHVAVARRLLETASAIRRAAEA